MEREKENILDIKKSLSNELLESIRRSQPNILDLLVEYGYSYEEITWMLTNYDNVSGLDLINCNEVVKKSLTK